MFMAVGNGKLLPWQDTATCSTMQGVSYSPFPREPLLWHRGKTSAQLQGGGLIAVSLQPVLLKAQHMYSCS